MGEYLYNNIKVGTCEDLYYSTYKEMLNVNDNAKHQFLNPAHGYRFRFPFPDEDGRRIGDSGKNHNFHRGYFVVMPDLLFNLINEDGEGHREIFIRHENDKDSAFAFSVSVDCPYGNNFKGNYWSGLKGFEIVSHKIDPFDTSQLVPVLRCPHCDHMFRVNVETLKEIHIYLLDHENEEYNEIGKRLILNTLDASPKVPDYVS